MKEKLMIVNVSEIDSISTNIDRSLEVKLIVKEDDFIESILDEVQLKKIFYVGSYNVEEVVNSFGIEEITEYIYGLGSR